METSLALLLLFGALLTVSTLCVWTLRHLSKQHERNEQSASRLLDKSIALLASRDALTYQSVQFMDAARYDSPQEDYDPSDEGEMTRIDSRRGEDDLNGPERAAAEALDGGDFFAPGF